MNMKLNGMLFAAALFAAPSVWAVEVAADEASAAVAGWVNLKAALGEDFTAQPANVREYKAKDGKGKYYVVELEGGGFVVTSGDTDLEPVLAYSKGGTWVDDVKRNPLLAMLPIDVAGMTAELGSADSTAQTSGRRLAAGASSSSATASANASKWAKLKAAASSSGSRRLAAGSQSSVSDLRVDKLLTSRWGQDGGNVYNYYVPNHYPCGCLATAGAQIMYYHKWPRNTTALVPVLPFRGKVGSSGDWTLSGYRNSSDASYTAWDPAFGGPYDWNLMNDAPSWYGDMTPAKAVGRLTRDVGIACHMDYASGGSGAHEAALYMRLKDQFGYANACFNRNLAGDSGVRSWKMAMLSNFDAKLPVSVEVPGHAIVADGYGYDGDTLYVHFNFGWNGLDDAWYAPPDLTDAGSAYNSIQCIIYNIYPEGTPDCTIVSGRLRDAAGSLVGSGVAVQARNKSTGAVVEATTDDNGIYALRLPAGEYAVGFSDGSGNAVATNLTVEACVSTGLVRNDSGKTEEEIIDLERNSSYYVGTGSVGNLCGVELQLAAVLTPVISPASGTTFYGASRTVSISCADAAAEVRYTTDGSEPTAASALYTEPFAVTATTTVKAKAFVGGYWSGAMATATIEKGVYYGDGGLYADTKSARAAHWVDEREPMQEATGAWSHFVEYVDGKVSFTEGNEFTASSPSKGAKTEVVATLYFDTWGAETDNDFGDVKTGIRVSLGGSFQLYTAENGVKKWVDVSAQGVTPAVGVAYTVKFTLSLLSKTYTASIMDGQTEKPLAASNGATKFAFASTAGGNVRSAVFTGEGRMESVKGSYRSGGVLILVQ